MKLTLLSKMLLAAGVLAAAVGAVYGYGAWQYGRGVAAQKEASAREAFRILEQQTTHYTAQLEVQRKTDAQLRKNLAEARRAGAADRSELERLQQLLAAARGAASTDTAASTGADGAGGVFTIAGECSREYATLAAAARKDAVRIAGLQEYITQQCKR